jgi:hypothetical protein
LAVHFCVGFVAHHGTSRFVDATLGSRLARRKFAVTNIGSYAAAVRYLCRSNTGAAAAWWLEVERYPGIVRELLRSPSLRRAS